MPTPTVVDNIAKVSGYLAGTDIQQKVISPATPVDKNLPVTLYMERKALEWKLAYDSTNTTDLIFTTAYVYAMCGIYKDLANLIINNGAGGIVITGAPSSSSGGGGSFYGNLFS